jgi:hypothetical protein
MKVLRFIPTSLSGGKLKQKTAENVLLIPGEEALSLTSSNRKRLIRTIEDS